MEINCPPQHITVWTCFCFSLVPRVAGAKCVGVCIVEIYHPPQHLFLFQLGTTSYRCSVCLGGSVCCCLYCGDIPSPSTPVFVSAWYHVLQVLSVFGWFSLLLSVLWRYTIPLNTCFCFSLVPRPTGAQSVGVCIVEIYHPPQHLFLFQLGTTSYRCSVCWCLYCGDIPSPSTPVFVSAWYHVLQVLSVFGWFSLLSVLWRCTIPLNTCFCFSVVPRVAGAKCVWLAQSVVVCIVEIYHPPQHLFLFQLGTMSCRCSVCSGGSVCCCLSWCFSQRD